MSINVGHAQVSNLTGGYITSLDSGITGYCSPNLQTLRISHSADDNSPSKDQSGRVAQLYFAQDDILEMSFDVIPQGGGSLSTGVAAADSTAEALISAAIPKKGTGFDITGLPIIQMGAFADGINTKGGSTQPWIYEGGATINGPADGRWTMTLPLKRYAQITSATPKT